MQELAASAGAKAKDHASPAEGADDLTDKLQQILMASGSGKCYSLPKLDGTGAHFLRPALRQKRQTSARSSPEATS